MRPKDVMNNKIIKRILRIMLWSISIFIFLTMVFATLVYVKRDKIKQLIITELNKELLTEIKVKSIGIEFFRTFPQTSLYLNDILAYEPKEFKDSKINQQDTLFYFQKLYLTFNVIDILHDNYKIKKIIAKNGCFNMSIDSLGRENYIFWKNSDQKPDSKFSFSLNNIKLFNIRFIYNNKFTNQIYSINFNEANARGDFNEKKQNIRLKTKGIINNIQLDNLILSNNSKIQASIDFLNNTLAKEIEIKSGDLDIDGLLFDVEGKLNYKDDNIIDLSIKSNKIKIDELINLLPKDISKSFQDYKSKGFLDFDFNMKGIISHTEIPNIDSRFNISGGSLVNSKLKLGFSNINLNGSFSNGKERKSETSYIKINNLSLDWETGHINGSGKIQNFSNLGINAKLKTNISLTTLKKLINQKEIKELNGKLNLELEIKGDLKSFEEIGNKGLEKIHMKGIAKIFNLNYSDTRFNHSFKNTNGEFIFDNQSIIINNLRSNIENSNIDLKAELIDILPYIFSTKQSFSLKGNLNIDKLNINDWIINDNKSNIQEFSLPNFINLNLNTSISNLIYENINIESFRGKVILYKDHLNLSDFRFNVFEGKINGNIDFDINKRTVFGNFSINSIDVKSSFSDFNNFGQTIITAKNIKGKITANIDYSTLLNKNFTLDMNTLNARVDYKIEDGELNNVEILNKLSYFVDAKELKNIRFQEIKSNFQISNSSINIGEINFLSNAINFSIFGKHYFDNKIDYRLKIKLSELSSKNKKAKLEKHRQEFGEIEEDEDSRITLFIRIGGSVENPIFSYDKKRNIKKAQEKIKLDSEKITKSINKDLDLGIEKMKKDKLDWTRQQTGEYIIDWENSPKDDSIKVNKKEKETKFNIEWE